MNRGSIVAPRSSAAALTDTYARDTRTNYFLINTAPIITDAHCVLCVILFGQIMTKGVAATYRATASGISRALLITRLFAR